MLAQTLEQGKLVSLVAEKEVQLVHKEQDTQVGEVQLMVLQGVRRECPLKEAYVVKGWGQAQ